MENRVSFQLPVLLISSYHYLFMLRIIVCTKNTRYADIIKIDIIYT